MAEVRGLEQVLASLRSKSAEAGPNVRLVVGYATSYALYVHEDMQARHATGQAKFLEQPARVHKRDMARIVRDSLRAGRTMEEALTDAGNFLLNVSKPLVPVDTGRLRNSGFVEVR
jgi:hypothetical protein